MRLTTWQKKWLNQTNCLWYVLAIYSTLSWLKWANLKYRITEIGKNHQLNYGNRRNTNIYANALLNISIQLSSFIPLRGYIFSFY